MPFLPSLLFPFCLCWSEKQIADYRCGLRLLSFNPGCMASSDGNGQQEWPAVSRTRTSPLIIILRQAFLLFHSFALTIMQIIGRDVLYLRGLGSGMGSAVHVCAMHGVERRERCCVVSEWVVTSRAACLSRNNIKVCLHSLDHLFITDPLYVLCSRHEKVHHYTGGRE
jgi:hypothetical protein